MLLPEHVSESPTYFSISLDFKHPQNPCEAIDELAYEQMIVP